MNLNSNKKTFLEIWQSDSDKVTAYYRRRISKSGISEKSLDWRDSAGCLKFFNYAMEIIDPEKIHSIFDVGCGTGNFYYFFKNKYKKDVLYTGVDIVSEFIEFAKKRDDQLNIDTMNFLSFDPNDPNNKYDLVINLGGLNSRVRFFTQYLEYNILKMFAMSKKYVLFNIIVGAQDNYFGNANNKKPGHITSIEEKKLIKILDKIKSLGATYDIKKVSLFKGSLDAFVVIEK